jgi:hypothetical protein
MRLINRITEPNSFRVLLASSSRADPFGRGLQLPLRCGGLRLTEIAKAELAKRPQTDTVYASAETIRANGNIDEIVAYWRNTRAILQNDALWLNMGMFMGVIGQLPTPECVSLVDEIGNEAGMLLYRRVRGNT